MSDYVQDPEYSMQLAAPEDDPASYDWARLQEEVDQAIPGPFADITLASLQEDTGVETSDWSALNYALENGAWRDVFMQPDDDQGAKAQPGDQSDCNNNSPGTITDVIPDMTVVTATTSAGTLDQANVCDHPKCGSKSFKWKGDLVRHRKLHDPVRQFICTAQECNFSFTRNDKLRDHITTGHDDDTLFSCPKSGCQALLTKDLMLIHDNILFEIALRRKCPLPRCNFQLRTNDYDNPSVLDDLQQHFLDGHDGRCRKQFASLLAHQGYHYELADVLCPVCPDVSVFKTHRDFMDHLVDSHFGSFRQPTLSDYPYPKEGFFWFQDLKSGHRRVYEAIPRELHEHRRNILSLLPDFALYPVWADIQNCPGVKYRW